MIPDGKETSSFPDPETFRGLDASLEVVEQFTAIIGYNLEKLSAMPWRTQPNSRQLLALENSLFTYKEAVLDHAAHVMSVTGRDERILWASLVSMTDLRLQMVNRVLRHNVHRQHLLAFLGLPSLPPGKVSIPKAITYDMGAAGEAMLWHELMSDERAPEDPAGKLAYATECLLEDQLAYELNVFGLAFRSPTEAVAPIHPHHIYLDSHLERVAA